MAKILGLDLGTNSIGWAVVDDSTKKIHGTGVRIFPAGKSNIGNQKEKSKNAERREKRSIRKQYNRKRIKKAKLLEILEEYNLCPVTKKEIALWKEWDKEKKSAGRQFPHSKKFIEWLKLQPYKLRSDALTRQLTHFEFGRVLYHLNQHRGFASNRKEMPEKTMKDGDKDKGIVGYEDTKKLIEKYQTLGNALYQILPKEKEKYKLIKDENGKELRVRSRYTLRDYYVNEFNEIWHKQADSLGLDNIKIKVTQIVKIGNPKKVNKTKKKIQKLKTDNILHEIKSIIDKEKNKTKYYIEKKTEISLKEYFGHPKQGFLFWQREIQSQKHTLAPCEFEGKIYFDKQTGKKVETGKKPVQKSHPEFEEYRAYEFISRIEYSEKKKLDPTQRNIALNYINSQTANFKFIKLKESLGLHTEKFNYDDEHDVPANKTTAQLQPLFSDNVWQEYKDEIWHCFTFYKDSKRLFKKLKNDFDYISKGKEEQKISDELLKKLKNNSDYKPNEAEQKIIDKIDKIKLNDDYGSISLHAVRNILPFLRECYRWSDAVVMGGVRNAFGKHWQEIEIVKRHKEIEDAIIEFIKEKNEEGELILKIKNYLAENKFGFAKDDKAFYKLYHHSQETVKKRLTDNLENPKNLRNPIVQHVLYELKKLVNEICKDKKYLEEGARFDKIHVELARELKQPAKQRMENLKENKIREEINNGAKDELDQHGLAHSRDNIHKYVLWDELRNHGGVPKCPYTGVSISIGNLFNDNKFQIEHIIPYSISLDDSLANKTICESQLNKEKGERTPYQYFKELLKDDAKWELVGKRVFDLLPYNKAKKFTATKIDENDFLKRQLNDTRYISREAKDYLKSICEDVNVFPGALTAELRHKWGLNSILNPEFPVEKTRNKGAHYAIINKETGEIKAIKAIFNKRPSADKNKIVIKGIISKQKGEQTFHSKYLNADIQNVSCTDGEYWAETDISERPVKFIKFFTDIPKTENDILIYGKLSKVKDKEEYQFDPNTDYIKKKLFKSAFVKHILNKKEENLQKGNQKDKNKTKEQISCCLKIPVNTSSTDFKEYNRKKKIFAKENEVKIIGKVENGIFSSKQRTLECPDMNDGLYNVLMNVDFENASIHKTLNDKSTNANHINILGHVKENKFYSYLDRNQIIKAEGLQDENKYWAVFEIKQMPKEFLQIKNPLPDKKTLEENEKLFEGTILEIDEKQKLFVPYKHRDDHRHHAIDAIVIAFTTESSYKKLSNWSKNKKNKLRGDKSYNKDLEFNAPWEKEEFRQAVSNKIQNILVSHRQNKNIAKSISKKIKRKTLLLKAKGHAASGSIHDATIYGRRNTPEFLNNENKKINFHIRQGIEKITQLLAAGKSGINCIVDLQTRINIYNLLLKEESIIKLDSGNIIKKTILKSIIYSENLKKLNAHQKYLLSLEERKKLEDENFFIQKFVEENKKKIQEYSLPEKLLVETKDSIKNYKLFMKNGKGGADVPVKKVRIYQVFKDSTLHVKPSQKIFAIKKQKEIELNQHAEPQNNHHIIVYIDKNSDIKWDIVPFWKALQRKMEFEKYTGKKLDRKEKEKLEIRAIYQLPTEGIETVATFQENDMYIIGLKQQQFNKLKNDNNYIEINKHLYRVQNIGRTGYKIKFRHQYASEIDNKEQEIGIATINNDSWKEYNPISVKISLTGQLV